MKTLTIIIPVYNIKDYLVRCFESVINQDYPVNVLLVDDGSTDGSSDICQEYAFKYDFFKYFYKQNEGLAQVRNYGLNKVNSDYLMFLDGDDYLEPNVLKKLVNKMEETDADVLQFNYLEEYVQENKQIENKINLKENYDYNLKVNPELLAYTPNSAWSKVYKVALLKDNNIEYPKGRHNEDFATTPKILYFAQKVVFYNVYAYHYLIDRPNNITGEVSVKVFDVFSNAFSLVNFFQDKKEYFTLKPALYYLVMINMVNKLKTAMRSKDRDLVFRFIDQLFNFQHQYFKNVYDTYQLKNEVGSAIYLNHYLCKLYYIYKQWRKK